MERIAIKDAYIDVRIASIATAVGQSMAVVAHDRVKSGNARYDGLPSSTISGHRMKRHGAGNDELVSLYGSGVDINGVSPARRSDVGKMGFIMTIVLDNRNAVYYIITVNAPVFFIGLATVCARSDDDGNIRIGNTAGIELFYEDLEHDIAHAKARNITDDDGHSLPCLKIDSKESLSMGCSMA